MASKAKVQADKQADERLAYSVPEAGRKLGLGRNASYAAAARGDFPVVRIGRREFVPIARFNKLLAGE